jgi:hypothetical protein
MLMYAALRTGVRNVRTPGPARPRWTRRRRRASRPLDRGLLTLTLTLTPTQTLTLMPVALPRAYPRACAAEVAEEEAARQRFAVERLARRAGSLIVAHAWAEGRPVLTTSCSSSVLAVSLGGVVCVGGGED